MSATTSISSFEAELQGFFSVTSKEENLQTLLSAFVNNPNAVLLYKSLGDRAHSPITCQRLDHVPTLEDKLLFQSQHFTNPSPDRGHVKAFYATDPETKTCKFACYDIDKHTEKDSAEKNWKNVLILAEHLRGLGFHPVIEDSNGVGGYHLWLFFENPVEHAKLYDLLECVKNYRNLQSVEQFPKNKIMNDLGCPIRAPGLHHTKDHVSKFWKYEGVIHRGAWVSGAEAAEYLINQIKNNPSPVKFFESYVCESKEEEGEEVFFSPDSISVEVQDLKRMLACLPVEVYREQRDPWFKDVMVPLASFAKSNPELYGEVRSLAIDFSKGWIRGRFNLPDFEEEWQKAIDADFFNISRLQRVAETYGFQLIDPEDPETWGGYILTSPVLAGYLNELSKLRRVEDSPTEGNEEEAELLHEDRTYQGLATLLLNHYFTDKQENRRLYLWREDVYLYSSKKKKYLKLSPHGMRRLVTKQLRKLANKLYDTDVANWKNAGSGGKPPGKISLSSTVITSVKVNLEALIDGDDDQQEPNQFIGRVEKGKRYLPLQNGILDIFKAANGEGDCLYPHTPGFFNLTVLPYAYDPTAKPGKYFDHYCRTSLDDDPEKIKLFLEYLGYVLSGSTDAHKSLVLLGEAASGKSSGSGIYQAIIGEENISGVKLKRLTETFSAYSTYGKILNICPEIERDGLMNDAVFKTYVCGEPMEFEGKGKDLFTARPTARLLICGNELPTVIDKSDGVWRRFMILEMDKVVPEKDRISGFDKPEFWVNQGEAPGILNAALLGLGEFIKRGCKFLEPQSSKDAVEEAKTASNSVKSFLKECTHKDPNGKYPKSHVFGLYLRWMKDNGSPHHVKSNTFGKELNKVYPQQTKKNPRMKTIDAITGKESNETAYTGFSFDPGTVGGEPIIPDQNGDYRIVKDLPGWIASSN